MLSRLCAGRVQRPGCSAGAARARGQEDRAMQQTPGWLMALVAVLAVVVAGLVFLLLRGSAQAPPITYADCGRLYFGHGEASLAPPVENLRDTSNRVRCLWQTY